MDSIQVRDGFTLYVFAHGADIGVPPPVEADPGTDAINCTTGEHFFWSESENRWINRTVEYGQPLQESLRTLICNR